MSKPIRLHTIEINDPNRVMVDTPRVAEREKTKAKMPIGATAMIQPIRTNMASFIPVKKCTTVSLFLSSIRKRAIANSPVNTNNCNMDPSTAAENGFTGISVTIQSLNGGRITSLPKSLLVLSRSSRLTVESISNKASKGGAATRARSAEPRVMTINNPIDFAPSLATQLLAF